ncbi:MAG: DUF4421 family protein [bacterium]
MSKFNLLFISITLIFHSVWLFAVEDKNNSYIQKFYDSIIIEPFVSQQKLELRFESTETGSTQRIDYKPNIKTNAGFSASYKSFGGAVSWNNGATALDNTVYGKSDYIDFQFSFYGSKFGIDAVYQKYKKFYLDDPKKFYSLWQAADPYPQREDLRIDKYFTNLIYVFSHDKFSLRAAVNQTEKQLKNAGSFLLITSASFVDIKSNYSLIPASHEKYFTEIAGFTGGEFIGIALAPGYAYSFVWKNFYFTPYIFFGPNIVYQRYEVTEGKKTSVSGGAKGILRLGTGYNGDKFFAGIYWNVDSATNKQKEVSVGSSSMAFKIFCGSRF